jgi:hypothetical protein
LLTKLHLIGVFLSIQIANSRNRGGYRDADGRVFGTAEGEDTDGKENNLTVPEISFTLKN